MLQGATSFDLRGAAREMFLDRRVSLAPAAKGALHTFLKLFWLLLK